MATSGTYSYTYTFTVTQLVTDALRTLGVIEEGGTASADQLTDSLPSLEMYIKSLSKYGLNLWTINSASEAETLVSGTATYTTDYPALKILGIYHRDSSNQDTPLTPNTREEWWRIGDKTTTGTPTQFFFDPNNAAISTGTIYLWPVPDATVAGDTIQIIYQTLIQDAGATSNTLDIPAEWLETIKYGLAVRLAPSYGTPTAERSLLIKEYKEMLKESLDWDTEQESIYLQPEKR